MLKDRIERGRASHRPHSSHFNVNEERDYASEDPFVMRLHDWALNGDDWEPYGGVDYGDEESEG